MSANISSVTINCDSTEDITVETNRRNFSLHCGVRWAPFIPDDPSLWFAIMDTNFQVNGITSDDEKFAIIINMLPPQNAIELRDFIIDPPSTEKYTALKVQVIRKRLERENKGKRSASQFLLDLKKLAGPAISDLRVRGLWMSRLPTVVQDIIRVPEQKLKKLEDIGFIANVVFDNLDLPRVEEMATFYCERLLLDAPHE